MSTPPTLHERLADLAEQGPSGGPAPDLWDAGVRRQRRRRVQGVAALTAVVALVAGAGFAIGTQDRDETPLPADAPFADQHLPRTVHIPSEWAEGSDEAGPPGPLAVVSLSTRSTPDGWTGVRRGTAAYGISAVDGSLRFLDLLEGNAENLSLGAVVLSPDGTKVGYERYRGTDLLGWGVYDTTTGVSVRLSDPSQPVIRGRDAFEMEFSGDSRYLQTNYSLIGSDGSRDDSFVVWDVETGEPTVAEDAGRYWLPNLGSAPSGIVWSRGSQTYRFDPVTGALSTQEAPQEVVEASYSADGRSWAYIAFGEQKRDPWRLFVEGRLVDLDIEPGAVLGWRDPQTVVVENFTGQQVRYVDVGSGDVVATDRLRIAGDDNDPLMGPVYAADLWANDLVDGARPPDVGDPRTSPWEAAGWVAVGAALLGLAAWILRRRRARP